MSSRCVQVTSRIRDTGCFAPIKTADMSSGRYYTVITTHLRISGTALSVDLETPWTPTHIHAHRSISGVITSVPVTRKSGKGQNTRRCLRLLCRAPEVLGGNQLTGSDKRVRSPRNRERHNCLRVGFPEKH